MNDSGYLHLGALDGILQRSCAAAAAAILFGITAGPAFAAHTSGSEGSQQSGFMALLSANEGIIWIAFYAVLTIFIVLLGWEIWVRLQIKQNGGVMPDVPSDGEADADGSDSGKDDMFTSPVLDESEDPFKALLNKASNDEPKNAPKDNKPEAVAVKPAPAPDLAPAANVPAREPFRNNVNINTDTDHIKRRAPAAPPVNGGFNGNATVNVSAASAAGPIPSGQRGAPPPGRVGFTPPKPVQGSVQFSANPGLVEHKPAAPAGSGMPMGGPGFNGAAPVAPPARPKAPGGVGLVPPKPPAAPGGGNMMPPVNRPNVNAPAPPVRRPPAGPPAVNFGKPGAPAGVTPPKHVGLGNNMPGGRPAANINVGPPKPPAMPFGGGGFNAPKSPGAPQPPAAPNRSSDEDSWKALSGSMASPQPPKAPKAPAAPNAAGGQGSLSLDIKRNTRTLTVE